MDIDECDELAARYKIELIPTMVFFRNGFAESNIVGTIKGSTNLIDEFQTIVKNNFTMQEMLDLQRFLSDSPGDNVGEILKNLTATGKQVDILAKQPLQDCNPYVSKMSRTELGLANLNPELPFDVTRHEHAQTAPAISVLARFKDDIAAYANETNSSASPKITHLSDKEIVDYFNGDKKAEKTLREALIGVKELQRKLELVKEMDTSMVTDALPMLERAANWIKLKKDTDEPDDEDKTVVAAKTRFILNRYAGQNSFVWIEFLFGSLLSTCGEQDLLKLNPYLSAGTLDAILSLVTMSMLRANRLGHTNRCIGTVISLISLLEKVRNYS